MGQQPLRRGYRRPYNYRRRPRPASAPPPEGKEVRTRESLRELGGLLTGASLCLKGKDGAGLLQGHGVTGQGQ